MGDNAYRLKLPDYYGVPDDYEVFPSFNVPDLAPFMEQLDLRMSPSQPRENGANDQA